MVRIRFIAHIGLFFIFIYVFCFASPLLESSWTNWIWTLATGIPLFYCLLGLGTVAFSDEDDISFEGIRYLCTFNPLCVASIIIKILIEIQEIQNIVLLICILFFIEVIHVRRALSHIFSWMSLLLVWPYINFHLWYETIGFVIFFIFLLLQVALGLACSLIDEDDDPNEVKDIQKGNFAIVAIIMVLCLWFINHHSPILEQIPLIGYIYFTYCIIGIILAFTNNVAATIFVIGAGVGYFTFLSSWGTSLEWCVHGATSMWYWISLFFTTVWGCIVWGADNIGLVWLVTHMWDCIVWCVSWIWNVIVWIATHSWSVIVWIASKIWWLICWKWFWIGLAALFGLYIIVGIISAIFDKKPSIIIKNRFMTCPYCYGTMIEGKTTDNVTRGTAKYAARWTATSGIVLLTGGAGALTAKATTVGAIIGGPIGAGAGFVVGGLVGVTGTLLMKNKINKATDKGVDWMYNEFGDGVHLHFKCFLCDGEWEGIEKKGSIVDWHKI